MTPRWAYLSSTSPVFDLLIVAVNWSLPTDALKEVVALLLPAKTVLILAASVVIILGKENAE